MSQLYARVFTQILDSSLAENWQTRHVFEDFLKLASDGVVDMTRQAIARRTNVPLEVVNAAIAVLEAPDPASRDAAEQGRRLLRLDDHRDWGWEIVNWSKYESVKNSVDQREQARERKRRQRQRERTLPPAPPTPKAESASESESEDCDMSRSHRDISVTPCNKPKAASQQPLRGDSSDSSATFTLESDKNAPTGQEGGKESKPDRKQNPRFQPPTLETCRMMAAKAGLPDTEAQKFYDYYSSNGWRVGKNAMRSAEHAFGGWATRYRERNFHGHGASAGQAAKPPGNHTSLTVSTIGSYARHVAMAQPGGLRRPDDSGNGAGSRPVGA